MLTEEERRRQEGLNQNTPGMLNGDILGRTNTEPTAREGAGYYGSTGTAMGSAANTGTAASMQAAQSQAARYDPTTGRSSNYTAQETQVGRNATVQGQWQTSWGKTVRICSGHERRPTRLVMLGGS